MHINNVIINYYYYYYYSVLFALTFKLQSVY